MKRPPGCITCGVALAPKDCKHVAEGERRYAGNGLCTRCYDIERTRPRRAEVDASEDTAERRRYNEGLLVAYIRARRERGWPDDGTLAKVEAIRELEVPHAHP